MSYSIMPTVLIVEDEALIAMGIEMQLQDMGTKPSSYPASQKLPLH